MNITRRQSLFAAITGLLAMTPQWAKAQNQGTANDVQIVSTGNVQLDSAIGATQSVITFDANGFPMPSQSVSSGVQVVSTGNVGVSNTVAADQNVMSSGDYENGNFCTPGDVRADPQSGNLYFCDVNCFWHPVPCNCQPQKRCRNC